VDSLDELAPGSQHSQVSSKRNSEPANPSRVSALAGSMLKLAMQEFAEQYPAAALQ